MPSSGGRWAAHRPAQGWWQPGGSWPAGPTPERQPLVDWNQPEPTSLQVGARGRQAHQGFAGCNWGAPATLADDVMKEKQTRVRRR